MGIMSDLSLRLSANTGELKSGLADAQKSLNDFGKDAKSAASKITDSFKDIGAATSNIKEMRTALMQLKGISFAGKSKEEIHAINTEIGRLTDEMGDLRAIQNSMGVELGTAMAKGLQVVAAMGEVAVGVATMFGASKEQAEKYQKVMTTLIGVTQGLGVIEDAFATKLFKTIGLRLAETVATVKQTIANWALNTSMLALYATIGAIVVVIAAVVVGIYLLVKSFSDSADATKKQTKAYEELNKANKTINDGNELAVRILKARGVEEDVLAKAELNRAQVRQKQIIAELDLMSKITKKTEDQKTAQKELWDEYVKNGDDIIIMKRELNAETDKSKDKAKEEAGAFDQLSGKISKLESGIKNVIVQGGVVTPAMLDALGKYYSDLEKATNEAERLKKLSYGRVDEKMPAIKPIKAKPIDVQKTTVEFDTKGLKTYANTMTDVGNAQDKVFKKSQTGWNIIKDGISDTQFILESLKNGIDGITGAFTDLFSGTVGGFKNVVTSMLQGVQQIINALLAQAIAAMIAKESSKGLIGLAFAAVGVAGLIGLWKAKVPEFAMGGVVGGNSYSGDKVPVRVNSGEMILNGSQQARLFAMANGSNSSNNGRGNQVEFVLRGDVAYGLMNNYSKKMIRTR